MRHRRQIVHAQYFAIQVNWMWNQNDVTLVSSYTSPQAAGFYEQTRASSQHALVFDGLIYFRRLNSSIRPYPGTGLSIGRFSSEADGSLAQGLTPPAGEIRSTHIGLRSHVGIDLGCRVISRSGTASVKQSAATRLVRR